MLVHLGVALAFVAAALAEPEHAAEAHKGRRGTVRTADEARGSSVGGDELGHHAVESGERARPARVAHAEVDALVEDAARRESPRKAAHQHVVERSAAAAATDHGIVVAEGAARLVAVQIWIDEPRAHEARV